MAYQFDKRTKINNPKSLGVRLAPIYTANHRYCTMSREERVELIVKIKNELKGKSIETKYYSGSNAIHIENNGIQYMLNNIKKTHRNWEKGPIFKFENAEVVEHIMNNKEMASTTGVYLNFASATHEGGGFKSGRGALAQEEALCMTSDLWASLSSDEAKEYYRRNNEDPGKGLYTHDILYTPKVTFSRSGSLCNPSFAELREPIVTAIVTSPSVNFNEYNKRMINNNKGGSWSRANRVMQERMNRVMYVCLNNGKRDLVMGPWGCGVFGGSINKLMMYVMKSPYVKYFDSISFISPDQSMVYKMKQAIGII